MALKCAVDVVLSAPWVNRLGLEERLFISLCHFVFTGSSNQMVTKTRRAQLRRSGNFTAYSTNIKGRLRRPPGFDRNGVENSLNCLNFQMNGQKMIQQTRTVW